MCSGWEICRDHQHVVPPGTRHPVSQDIERNLYRERGWYRQGCSLAYHEVIPATVLDSHLSWGPWEMTQHSP